MALAIRCCLSSAEEEKCFNEIAIYEMGVGVIYYFTFSSIDSLSYFGYDGYLLIENTVKTVLGS